MPSLVEIALVVREKNFFLICYFSIFRNYLPSEKGGNLHLKKKLNPFYPRMRCAKVGWNCPSGFEEENENVKSLQQRQRLRQQQLRRLTMDKIWSEKLNWTFSSGELNNIYDFNINGSVCIKLLLIIRLFKVKQWPWPLILNNNRQHLPLTMVINYIKL